MEVQTQQPVDVVSPETDPETAIRKAIPLLVIAVLSMFVIR